MSTYSVLLAVQCFSVVILFAETIFVFQRIKTDLQAMLFLSCLATLINNIGYMLEMMSDSMGSYMYGLYIAYLGKVWIPFAFFMLAMKMCNVHIKKRFSAALACFHILIFGLVITSKWQTLYYRNRTYVTTGLFPHVEVENGIMHTVYSIVMIVYIIVGTTFLVRTLIQEKEPRIKLRFVTITAAITVESVFYILHLVCEIEGYDMTALGYALGAIIMGIGLFRHDMMGTMEMARDYIIDEIPEAIIVMDARNNIEFANLRAKACFDLGINARKTIEDFNEAIENHEPIYVGDRIFNAEKKELTHEGAARGTVYVLEDDTELLEHNKALRAQKDIAEIARQEAESANESKSSFLSMVSHEIRTPMNAVVGMTELILNDSDNLTATQKKYLGSIKTSGNALVMIVNDILDLSKIEAGKMEIVEDDYELMPMVDDIKLLIENRIGNKPIEVKIVVGSNVPKYMIGDSLRIRQVLINLMNNAVKFTEKGYIKLMIMCAKDLNDRCAITFTVQDTGQGIKPKDIGKLGESFAQVDTKKNHFVEGTGLGLNISRNFIDMMGGHLDMMSVYGEGTSFSFTIWQKKSKGINLDGNENFTNQFIPNADDFTCPNARLLIVDDTEVNLTIAKELMKPLGATIDTVTSGEEALEAIRQNKYDAIFMDYMMPSMDGVQTTGKIREIAKKAIESGDLTFGNHYSKVPIITLTGDTSSATKEKFIQAGIDDFMIKPFNLDEAKKRLAKWLDKELIILT